jgi:ABC-2 type transport system ATP-binding protein
MTAPRSARLPSGVETVVHRSDSERQTTLLGRVSGPIFDPAWTSRAPDLEELVLAYMSDPEASDVPPPVAVGLSSDRDGHQVESRR